MLRFANFVRRGWLLLRGEPAAPVPFEIVCPCGHVTTGIRRTEPQVLACASCAEILFVLPLSRLSPVLSEAELAQRSTWPKRLRAKLRRLGPWQQALLAGGITLLSVVLILYITLRSSFPGVNSVENDPAALARHLETGRGALSQGKVHLAQRELSDAVALARHFPAALTMSERRQLTQLHRQAALLAELLAEPLEDILRRAADLTDLDEHEWQAAFRARYRGRAIIIEDEVRRDSGGQYRLPGYKVLVRGKPALLELGDLQLLHKLPLENPQRLLLGARLASIERAPGGAWTVRFQPDSGVLLTDFGAAAICSSLPPAELRVILERQAAWLAELP